LLRLVWPTARVELFALCGRWPLGVGVRWVAGWSALRDVVTTLVWSGALGESVGAWFGVRFVWAPNGRRADDDITDHRPPHALAPPTRCYARFVPELRRRARGPLRLRHFVVESGPSRLCAGACAGPGRLMVNSSPSDAPHRPHDDPGRFRRPYDVQTDPDPAPRDPQADGPFERGCIAANRPTLPEAGAADRPAQRATTPLTPLGADRPRRALRPTPERNAYADAPPWRSQQPGPPRDQRPTTSVFGGPLPVPARGDADAPSSWCCRSTTELRRSQRLCVADQFCPSHAIGSARQSKRDPRDR
jgi:hypothetical protein